jgi:hypothetical protein
VLIKLNSFKDISDYFRDKMLKMEVLRPKYKYTPIEEIESVINGFTSFVDKEGFFDFLNSKFFLTNTLDRNSNPEKVMISFLNPFALNRYSDLLDDALEYSDEACLLLFVHSLFHCYTHFTHFTATLGDLSIIFRQIKNQKLKSLLIDSSYEFISQRSELLKTPKSYKQLIEFFFAPLLGQKHVKINLLRLRMRSDFEVYKSIPYKSDILPIPVSFVLHSDQEVKSFNRYLDNLYGRYFRSSLFRAETYQTNPVHTKTGYLIRGLIYQLTFGIVKC